MKNKEIYDIVYSKNTEYNLPMEDKYHFIDEFIEGKGSILDVGCGQGNNLKRLFNSGCDITGIEISEVCCNRYLSGYPHINIGLSEYADCTIEVYDCLFCFDVLEHISYEDLDIFLNSCKKLSKSVLFGIANHSDIQFDIELHIIQQDSNWWKEKLLQTFSIVDLIYNSSNFYIFEGKTND